MLPGTTELLQMVHRQVNSLSMRIPPPDSQCCRCHPLRGRDRNPAAVDGVRNIGSGSTAIGPPPRETVVNWRNTTPPTNAASSVAQWPYRKSWSACPAPRSLPPLARRLPRSATTSLDANAAKPGCKVAGCTVIFGQQVDCRLLHSNPTTVAAMMARIRPSPAQCRRRTQRTARRAVERQRMICRSRRKRAAEILQHDLALVTVVDDNRDRPAEAVVEYPSPIHNRGLPNGNVTSRTGRQRCNIGVAPEKRALPSGSDEQSGAHTTPSLTMKIVPVSAFWADRHRPAD